MTPSGNPTEFPDLETARLQLRALSVEDTPFIYSHFGNAEVAQYLMDEPPLTEYAEAEAIIQFYQEPAGKPYNRWVIVRKSDQQLMGTCGYHKWDKRQFRAEIGYDLSPDFWGQGYMAEALTAVIQHGFARMDLHRIEAIVYLDNGRSVRLLQRLGFKQEGILRDYYYQNGHFYDHCLFSLLRSEWKGDAQ